MIIFPFLIGIRMAEVINDRKIFSLLEVTLSIQKTIAERYTSSFWVKAEMNKLNHYSNSGHCYPELVEKKDGRVVAQIKANLWKGDYQRINATFLSLLKEPLKDGIKILFCASISFDPSHGLSLRIIDIDPSFSLGELEREKIETITKLKKEGIYDANRRLTLPLLPQRLAIISVETSKGYSDYLKVIEQNPWGYKFFNLLFPALLQGERSVISILDQLRRIKKVKHHFDAVAIIRGGGGDVGLSSYNNYTLAREIALFPIPVFTGIGHSTNETVTEMVSFQNAITPTELADYLLQRFHDFSGPVKRAEEIIIDKVRRILTEEQLKLRNFVRYFKSITLNNLQRNHHGIEASSRSLLQQAKFHIKQNKIAIKSFRERLRKSPGEMITVHEEEVSKTIMSLNKNLSSFIHNKKNTLEALEKNISHMDPVNILKRGFTITMHNGRVLKSYKEVNEGDQLTTLTADGHVISKTSEANKSN
jgi:exodeoxyribonuclease VII large subunit